MGGRARQKQLNGEAAAHLASSCSLGVATGGRMRGGQIQPMEYNPPGSSPSRLKLKGVPMPGHGCACTVPDHFEGSFMEELPGGLCSMLWEAPNCLGSSLYSAKSLTRTTTSG